MKVIVTHTAPDWDAITSVWLIKRYLEGWQDAEVRFVPAGTRLEGTQPTDTVEKVGEDEIIHVDTGLGPLDHHQTSDLTVSAASRVWDYVQENSPEFQDHDAEKKNGKREALSKLVELVVGIDHFQEVFWADPSAWHHEFSLLGLLEGLELERPNEDRYYVEFGMKCLDAVLHDFENRLWAEEEIKGSGKEFDTRYGKAIAFEVINDAVIKIAQKMGYVIVIRKDPRKGYVRIKARPTDQKDPKSNIDLTPVYEKLLKLDPEATWFLHVSKKMLLNGSTKNPTMKPSKLSLDELIEAVREI